MSILRKTTGLVGFDAKGPNVHTDPIFVSDRQPLTPEELQPLLHELLIAESLEAPQAQEVLSKLRAVASRCGPFLTASEIQRCLKSFKFKGNDGKRLDRARAFELAAKLHWDNLHHLIETIEGESRPLGPTVFMTFLEELIECLFETEDYRKGVEIPIALADELLERALGLTRDAPVYVILAERAVTGTLDLYRDWLEKGAWDTAKQEPDNGADSDTDEAPETQKAEPLGVYLLDMASDFQKISTSLQELVLVTDAADENGGRPESAAAPRKLEYLRVIRKMSESTGYAPFRAMVLRHIAECLLSEDPDQARALTLEAAAACESQADKDMALRLELLAQRRTKLAQDLRAGSLAAAPNENPI